jgi:transposase
MNRYALRDDHWDRIKDLLPGKPGDVGVAAHDNRRFVEAVLYRCRTGIPWRDLPERLGDWKNTHERFSRGANKGDLLQRQRSRRRWWLGNLGRVSETLRGKRS